MIFTTFTLGIIVFLLCGIIVYLLLVIRAYEMNAKYGDEPLEPPTVSQQARNKVFGYDIRRFGEEAYQDGEFYPDER